VGLGEPDISLATATAKEVHNPVPFLHNKPRHCTFPVTAFLLVTLSSIFGKNFFEKAFWLVTVFALSSRLQVKGVKKGSYKKKGRQGRKQKRHTAADNLYSTIGRSCEVGGDT
jgi:hypothetical protein